MTRVAKESKFGYINTKSEQVMGCKFDYATDFREGFASVEKYNSSCHINANVCPVVFNDNKNATEVLDRLFVIKNSIYGKFEVLQRINETTFLIKIAGRDIFVDSEGNFRLG